MSARITVFWAAALVVALWGAWMDGARAETGNAAVLAQTLRKAQAMLVKLSEENTRLTNANRELETKLARALADTSERDALNVELSAREQALKEARGKSEQQVARINRDAERITKLKEQRQALRAALARQQSDDALLVEAVKERSEWIALCTRNNSELVRLNGQLLEQRVDGGWWQKVKDVEPITNAGRVAAEQAEQDFRFKLEDLSVTPWQDETRDPP